MDASAGNVYYKQAGGQLGLGAFAGRSFRPGELVLRPSGRIVTAQTIYSIQIGWNRHLDPDPPAKYLNHSCDPNLGVRSDPDGMPGFYARRAITCDEHLTFDYAMTEYRHYPRSKPEQDFDLTCYCGAPTCRGRLGYYSELTPVQKALYQGWFSEYLLHPAPENQEPPKKVGVGNEP